LRSGNGHASLTSGEAACSEGTTAHELSEAHSGEAPDRRRDAQVPPALRQHAVNDSKL
jgi:hypothetical protein